MRSLIGKLDPPLRADSAVVLGNLPSLNTDKIRIVGDRQHVLEYPDFTATNRCEFKVDT